jgi:hypothetical protein
MGNAIVLAVSPVSVPLLSRKVQEVERISTVELKCLTSPPPNWLRALSDLRTFSRRNLNGLSVVFRGHREFFPAASEGFFPTRWVRFSDNLLKMPNRHFGITHAIGTAGILDRKCGYL